ncbi:hypothetical protein M2480_001385 [Parabacteroides sp. PFB2-12]|nr:hypothetical protein [Parabacteroides sp. PM6-13]MDH6390412.1 hypothetical protein [Parabacteroides sp. PFB2-12]
MSPHEILFNEKRSEPKKKRDNLHLLDQAIFLILIPLIYYENTLSG